MYILISLQSYLLGGSYDGSMELHSGELTFTLASGSSMKLYLSKVFFIAFNNQASHVDLIYC